MTASERGAPQTYDPPSQEQVDAYLARRNWGRWGDDDQRGMLNLITAERRAAAAATVRTGEAFSLGRPLPTWTGPGNPNPAQHYMKMDQGGGQNVVNEGEPHGGYAADYYGSLYHGVTTTHLDALCHVWDRDGMYNGRDPREHITYDGATFGGIEHWAEGIFTRAVLLDVPRFRGTDYVVQDEPVMGWELEEILVREGITLSPGDAVAVYAGRDKWQAANPDKPYGRHPFGLDPSCAQRGFAKPGLSASCLPFLRDHDVSTLVWDMLDNTPHPYDVPFAVHGSIHAYGMALVDNAALETFTQECAAVGRTDFLLVVAPLLVLGGTGSPVNPIAIL